MQMWSNFTYLLEDPEQGDQFEQLDTLNLFDSDDHDIDYFYASRLPAEPAEGIEDIHYHVFEPRQLRLSVGWRLC